MMLDIAAGIILGNIVTGLFGLGILAFVKDQNSASAILLIVGIISTIAVIGLRFAR